METTGTATSPKGSGRSVLLRILAALLALVLLFSVVVALLVRVVKPRQKTVSAELVEQVYSELSADDAYLNAPLSERIGTLFSTIGVTPASVSDFEQLASMYIGRGDYEEAKYMYEQTLPLIPKEQEVTLANMYYKLGSVSVLCGDLPAAEDYYERVLDYGVSSELIHILMAQVYLEQQKYGDAAEQLSLYLVYEPDDADNRELYANVLELSGDAAAAAGQYRLLYEASADPEQLLSIARAALTAADYPTVIDSLTSYMEQQADADGSLHMMRGMAALWTGDFQTTIDDLNEAENLGFTDADGSLHYMRGIAYLTAEEYAQADEDLLAAVSLGYDKAECYSQLSLSAYVRADYEKTAEYGTLACENTDTPDADCLQRLGLAEMQLQRYDEALTSLKKSLTVNSDLTLNYYFIATLYFLKKEYPSAVTAYTAAIDAGVYAQECLYDRGLCRMYLEDLDGAIEDLKASLTAGDDEEVITAAKDILGQLGVKIP